MTETQRTDVGPRPRSLDDVPPDILFATMHLSVTEVITVIAAFYDLQPATMRMAVGSKPKGTKGHAREMICFYLYRLFGRRDDQGGRPVKSGERSGHVSFRWIGRRLGYFDGSGPKHANRRITERAENDAELRNEIAMIEQRLAAYLRQRGKPPAWEE